MFKLEFYFGILLRNIHTVPGASPYLSNTKHQL